MSVIENALAYIKAVAADDSHGYDQSARWGPDYDCSSLVITAWKKAGLSLSSTYTGNMYSDFIAHGFTDVTGQVQRSSGEDLVAGDVLLNVRSHTAMYIGNGEIAQASINENGTVTGGRSGDQTGREIYVRSYYNYPLDYVLRYTGTDVVQDIVETAIATPTAACAVTLPLLCPGCVGESVKALQALLMLRGYELPKYAVDGDFGDETKTAVLTCQAAHGLEADAMVGSDTWPALVS